MILCLHDVAIRQRYKKAMKLWQDDVKRNLQKARLREATHALSKSDREKLMNELILSTCVSKRVNLNRKSDHSGSDSDEELS